MNRMEIESRSEQCVEISEDYTAVQLKNKASLGKLFPLGLNIWADRFQAGPEKDGFTFDRVFDTTTKQDEIFDWGVKGIVEGQCIYREYKHVAYLCVDVMTGFNGTLFCYGQTGSGKTFSKSCVS